jgi:hypothetical protein
MAVVAVWTQVQGNRGFLCSGTLISPQVVMTAGHCVTVSAISGTFIYFGNSLSSSTVRTVSEIQRHPQYSGSLLLNDIALIRLGEDPPSGVQPIPFLPHRLGITSADIGTLMEWTGFGQTDPHTDSSGVKMTMFNDLRWICTATEGCGDHNPAMLNTICQDQTPSGMCQGDSGGPAFILRGGREYVAGVASYVGEDCSYFGCSTKVDEFEDFIIQFAGDPEGTPCENDRDCLTGYCIDSVCCENACAGRCSICNLSGSEGMCLPVEDGTPCLDSSVCNGEEACLDGRCEPGDPLVCQDSISCTVDTCDPTYGCTFKPIATDCDDHNMCTRDVCDQETGCSYSPMPDGISCGDCLICEAGKCIDDPACRDEGCGTAGGGGKEFCLFMLLALIICLRPARAI